MPVPKLPSDYDALKKKGLVRKKLGGRSWKMARDGGTLRVNHYIMVFQLLYNGYNG